MKGTFLIILMLGSSTIMTAQVPNTTYGESRPESQVVKYGRLIMETPFGAKLYKNHFISGQDLLDSLKASCRGKAIFLNFWATWCPPCIDAMPDNKRIYFETKSLPVEFIYICTDNRTSIDNWITKISFLRQPGIHIFAGDDIIRDLWKLLPVGGGFPTYVFIDSKGNFRPEALPLNSGFSTERLSDWIKK